MLPFYELRRKGKSLQESNVTVCSYSSLNLHVGLCKPMGCLMFDQPYLSEKVIRSL